MIHRVRDPYDIWSLEMLGKMKRNWTGGKGGLRIALPVIGGMEWLFPEMFRTLLGVKRHDFPHVEAMLYLASGKDEAALLEYFCKTRSDGGWGLPFGWYSKNGYYGPKIPYVTNTPYVMEALLLLARNPLLAEKAMEVFDGTWEFLSSLKEMSSTGSGLALSYAPVDEPRMVINANSYAAFAYAMHAVHGLAGRQELARERAIRIANWVIMQQRPDGSWLYYADNDSGNFIDCFHSCFILKNLVKLNRLIGPGFDALDCAVDKGWRYLRETFYDEDHGICRRFAAHSHRDPFKWDLYDQAEYLGLLVDFGRLDEASEFAGRVEARFCRKGDWFCRIDFLGRRWGKGFLRWGIAPFRHSAARLHRKIGKVI